MPAELVGRLLGKGGETIASLRASTGARIRVKPGVVTAPPPTASAWATPLRVQPATKARGEERLELEPPLPRLAADMPRRKIRSTLESWLLAWGQAVGAHRTDAGGKPLKPATLRMLLEREQACLDCAIAKHSAAVSLSATSQEVVATLRTAAARVKLWKGNLDSPAEPAACRRRACGSQPVAGPTAHSPLAGSWRPERSWRGGSGRDDPTPGSKEPSS